MTSQPLESSQPLGKSQRLTLPSKCLRLKQASKEILHDLTIEFLTPKEIIQRRKCSKQAVYKVIKKLKQKGLFGIAYNPSQPLAIQSTFSQPLAMRLHGQEWNIKIISKSEKYQKIKKKANTIFIDGNTIRLYNDAIEVYSGQSFFEKDEEKATMSSISYWRGFFARLEHEFGVILVKSRVQNISLVNQHYGETESEMAKDSIERKQKYKIETDDDGKIWFLIDNSFNLKEMETLHPETAKQDMTKVRKQVNDWRKNDPPTNSELAKQNAFIMEQNILTMENVRNHLNVIEEIKQLIKTLNERFKA